MTDQLDVKFVVSIQCITYNHSAFIVDALNGFAIQKTAFPFVAVVIDDASTDGEQNVIRNYLETDCSHLEKTGFKQWETEDAYFTIAQHKDNVNCHFVMVCLKQNLFSNPDKKYYLVREWMNAKYIALCEGDDFWVDPNKLQRQVEILESDESLMAVVTNSKVVDLVGEELKSKQDNVVPGNKEGRYDLRSFMYKVHNYPTATVCYRRTHVDEIAKMTKHMSNPYLGDWTLWIALHVFGDFYYLDVVTSAYRINPTSVTHTCDRVGRAKAHWTICKAVQDILPDEYNDIRKSLDDKGWMWRDLAMAYRHERQYIQMLWCFFVALVIDPKDSISYIKKKGNKKSNKA